MDEKWKTVIVDLLAEDRLSFCLVSEKWKFDDRVYCPTYGSCKTHKALISHEEPDDSYQECGFVLQKNCGLYVYHLTVLKIDWLLLSFWSAEDYSAARSLFKSAVEESDLSSDQKKSNQEEKDVPKPSQSIVN
jgi:hypothetical protein